MTDDNVAGRDGMRPRVVHVLGRLDYGGLQLRVLNLIRGLPEFQHAVVVSETRPGPLSGAFVATCELVRCPYPRLGGPVYFVRLVAALRRLRPDAVLAHLFGNHALVAWAAALAGGPATFGVAASDPILFSGSRWRPWLLAQIARPVARGEIAVSEFVGGLLRSRLGLPSGRVTVIPNGCPVGEIRARVAASRAAVAPPDGVTRVLVAARLSRVRDHPTVLRAVAQLRATGRPVELWLAGDGRRRRELERTAATLGLDVAVRFLGNRDDVPELMAACDLLVHPSGSDAFGMVLVEAMAAGLPVVASDVEGCREVLDGGSCGRLYRPGDAADLATAIAGLADDAEARRRLVDAASRRVERRYEAARMAEDYARLVRRHLDGR